MLDGLTILNQKMCCRFRAFAVRSFQSGLVFQKNDLQT